MSNFNRRKFLKLSSLSVLPVFPASIPFVASAKETKTKPAVDTERVFFVNDGPMYRPTEYLAKLEEINKATPIQRDFYGEGGVIDQLTKKFAAITGKESCIYMPSGTMANQLAIAVLSGENTKVLVQDTSHVYRDEADAAQSVYNKRLIPLAKEQPHFTIEELQSAIQYIDQNEVFKSGIGAVSIENPVRRNDGRMFPLEEIKKISAYCKSHGYKLHLDGARIYLASAWSGISVEEYASYFDTVYISLYKYLGAGGGAVLCGDKAVIGKMQHLVKIHGGTVFSNWTNAAMALYHLDGLDTRLKNTVEKSKELFGLMNQLPEMKVTPLDNGTNIFDLQLKATIDSAKLSRTLREEHNIFLGQKNDKGIVKLMINETLLLRDNKSIIESFKTVLKTATV